MLLSASVALTLLLGLQENQPAPLATDAIKGAIQAVENPGLALLRISVKTKTFQEHYRENWLWPKGVPLFSSFYMLTYQEGFRALVDSWVARGVYITSTGNGPARAAGLLPGDKITQVNFSRINSANDLNSAVWARSSDRIVLSVERRMVPKQLYVDLSPTAPGRDSVETNGVIKALNEIPGSHKK